jgi:hypothetical protein
VFVPGKPFQSSLMFAGKAGAYPSGAPVKSFIVQASGVFVTVSHFQPSLIFPILENKLGVNLLNLLVS